MFALKRGSNEANHNFKSEIRGADLVLGLAGLPLTLLLESRCRICSVEESLCQWTQAVLTCKWVLLFS